MNKLIEGGLWVSLFSTICLELRYIYKLEHGCNQFSLILLYFLVFLDFVLLVVWLSKGKYKDGDR